MKLSFQEIRRLGLKSALNSNVLTRILIRVLKKYSILYSIELVIYGFDTVTVTRRSLLNR